MADLNETIVDVPKEDVDDSEEQEIKMDSENAKTRELLQCDKCDKIFQKKGQKDLHMKKIYNLKTMQYTPSPAFRRVGRPAHRFICETCKEKKKTESELKNHINMMHMNPRNKRGLTEMRQDQVQRAASVALSPPEKKINLNKTIKQTESEKKDQKIKSLRMFH